MPRRPGALCEASNRECCEPHADKQPYSVRQFTKLDHNKVRSEFLDRTSGCVEMAVEAHQYTREEYERAAVAGGMRPEAWKKLFATPDAVQQMGASLWEPCHEHQPFALFVAQKE